MERNLFCPTCQKQVAVKSGLAGRTPCPSCGSVLDVSDACDVFISYASEDRAAADEMAARLAAAGITCWLAHEKVRWGEYFVKEIRPAIEKSKVVVLILSMAAQESPWVQREVDYAIHSRRKVLPYQIEKFELSKDLYFSLLGHQVATREQFETNIDRAIALIHELIAPQISVETRPAPVPIPATPLPGVDWSIEPYVGPGPFEPQTQQSFCGREKETNKFLEMLKEHRVVLLYAPTGAGKSSLLNRSIHDSLEAQGFEVLTGARVGGPLPDTLKASQIRNIYTFAALYNLVDSDNSIEHRPAINMAEYLKGRRPRPGTRGRIVIFDQFEEMFTKHEQRFADRDEFFDDLIEALSHDDKLRVILAMRKEYLADILPKADKLTGALEMGNFPLDPLGPQGAMEAITLPIKDYAKFDEDVAGDIVNELMMIRVKDSDGVEVQQRGEFVDMVELQIVCSHLWKKIPEGTKQINREFVNEAIGEGRTLSEFAVNALDEFYKNTVAKVAQTKFAKDKKYTEELIKLGCMRFVTASATRRLVQRNPLGRTGLLPDAIINQLETLHLLRSEEHGTDRWYELAHDRLAEPVVRQRDSKLSALLDAEEILARMVEKARSDNGRKLDGYFDEHRDILNDCKQFHSKPGLISLDEAEFLFRASLVVGEKEEMVAWSERLATDYPQLREKVLRDALATASASHDSDAKHAQLLAAVRRNAARLVGLKRIEELMPGLVPLALSDPELSVRRAAALSLARLDEPELYDEIVKSLHKTATATAAQTALSNIRVAFDQTLPAEQKAKGIKVEELPAPRFESCFRRLAPLSRAKIRFESRLYRFEEGGPWFLIIAIPAAILAAISAAAFKWLPGVFGWSLEQKAASPGMGVFHGISGGVIWGGSIALGLTLYYIVFERQQDKKSFLQPYGAILAGGIFGFISSFLIVMVVVLVFEVDSLVGMGWISGQGKQGIADISRYAPQYWRDLFMEIRYGWVQHIIGTGMGIGMALSTNSLRAWGRWNEFLSRQKGVTSWTQSARLIRDIMPIALRRAWPIPLMIVLTAVLAYFVPKPQPPMSSEQALATIETNVKELRTSPKNEGAKKTVASLLGAIGQDPNEAPGFLSPDHKSGSNSIPARKMQLIHGLIADCASQIIGAYFAIVGMGFGIVIVRRGVNLEPWRN